MYEYIRNQVLYLVESIKTNHSLAFRLIPKDSPILATLYACFYISLFPTLLLLFILPFNHTTTTNNKSHKTDSVFNAFAIGSLLGDLLFHLLPSIYSSNNNEDKLTNAMFIFIGYLIFFFMELIMRLENNNKKAEKSLGNNNSINKKQDKTYKNNKENLHPSLNSNLENNNKIALLNIVADIMHNFTDGIALYASFQTNYRLGLSTFIAILFHEVPHELSDYMILRQNGYSVNKAFMMQFVTAVGAFLGCFCAILASYLSSIVNFNNNQNKENKLVYFSIDAVNTFFVCISAGGFMYITCTGLAPNLLKSNTESKNGMLHLIVQLMAILLGAFIMYLIALSEE